MADNDGLITRTCIACTKTDTDPKHVVALPDQSEVAFHIDCHAAVASGWWGNGGCPTCIQSLNGFEGKGGSALRKHIMGEN